MKKRLLFPIVRHTKYNITISEIIEECIQKILNLILETIVEGNDILL